MKNYLFKNQFVIFILAVFIFSGCVKYSKETVQNGDFTIEFLFEYNGCRMYRFKDGGRFIYWSDCQGKIQADYTTQQGKSTVTHNAESITTK